MVIPEVNNSCWGTLLTLIEQANLSFNLYQRQASVDSVTQRPTNKNGWYTSESSKWHLIGQAQNLILEWLDEFDDRVVNEMNTFVYNDSKTPSAVVWHHDDAVMADLIAIEGVKYPRNYILTADNGKNDIYEAWVQNVRWYDSENQAF